MPAPIPHRDLWPTVGHLVHTIPIQGGCNGTLLVYHSAIYPQGMAFKYGLGGRLGQPVHNARLYAQLPGSFLSMDSWMTSQLKVALIRKLCGPLMYLAYFFDMSAMGVIATSHWQTSGWLVQEFCTVYTYLLFSPFKHNLNQAKLELVHKVLNWDS